MRSHDRLVVCPECDELIVEDEWDLHKAGCIREGLLCQQSDDQQLDDLARRQQRDPHWYEKHDQIRRLAEQAVDRQQQGMGNAMFPGPTTIQPIQRIDPNFVTNGHFNQTIDYAKNTMQTTHAMIVKLPRVPLKREEAVALAIEQLYEQWEVCTDV